MTNRTNFNPHRFLQLPQLFSKVSLTAETWLSKDNWGEPMVACITVEGGSPFAAVDFYPLGNLDTVLDKHKVSAIDCFSKEGQYWMAPAEEVMHGDAPMTRNSYVWLGDSGVDPEHAWIDTVTHVVEPIRHYIDLRKDEIFWPVFGYAPTSDELIKFVYPSSKVAPRYDFTVDLGQAIMNQFPPAHLTEKGNPIVSLLTRQTEDAFTMIEFELALLELQTEGGVHVDVRAAMFSQHYFWSIPKIVVGGNAPIKFPDQHNIWMGHHLVSPEWYTLKGAALHYCTSRRVMLSELGLTEKGWRITTQDTDSQNTPPAGATPNC